MLLASDYNNYMPRTIREHSNDKKGFILKKLLGVAFTSLLLMACSPATEGELDVSHLERMGFTVESHQPAPIPGLVQVITDQGLIYTDVTGEKLISGRIYDMTSGEPVNLSDQTLNKMRQQDLAKVAASTIEYKADHEKYVIHVFTDVDCGYCRQFHKRLPEYLAAGITVRYLAWPRHGLASDTAELMRNAWCAEDSAAALAALKQDQPIATQSCTDPVAAHFALGHKFGVRGTPAIVLDSGRLIPGFVPPQQLLAELEP